jgi:hypothetical protein
MPAVSPAGRSWSEPLRRVIGHLALTHGAGRALYFLDGRSAEHGPAEGPVHGPQPQLIYLGLVQPGRRVTVQERVTAVLTFSTSAGPNIVWPTVVPYRKSLTE